MKKLLLLLIFTIQIAFAHSIFGQAKPTVLRLDLPSFIPVKNNFQTSLVFKFEEKNENLEINIQKPKNIEILSASIKLGDKTKEINFKNIDNAPNQIKISLNTIIFSLEENKFYQIIFTCYSSDPLKLKKDSFSWLDKNIFDDDLFIEKSETDDDELQIYEPQKASGKSLKFDKSSSLNIKIVGNENWKNLYTEFWLNINSNVKKLFNIRKNPSGDTLVSFSKNEFDFITFPLSNSEIIRNDIYLGKKSWNYIGVFLRKTFDGLISEVYVNSRLAYSARIENDFDTQNLGITISNNLGNSSFLIDRLKIWEFENNFNLAFLNKHFLSYEADSSKIIYQANFDNSNDTQLQKKLANLEISSSNLELVKSDSPIFSKAPKLIVNIGSSYNSIVWYVQEFSVAKEFVIERALGENEFVEVHRTIADNDPLKIYYFTDELFGDNEVTYYRVRQINNDESEVYSAEVKIGNREVQEFNLQQNYPNPFNPLTSIYVEVIFPTDFKVNVYDLVGNKVAHLHDGFLAEGVHTFQFDGTTLPSGIYFYEVISPRAQVVKKMILAK
jgi:hypothetical protein